MNELNITVCKFKEMALMVRVEYEEEESVLYFENPVTGKWYKEIEKSFDCWIEEQEESEIDIWNMLKDFIAEDINLIDKINRKIEFIDYEESN
jgi:hypothetical protein